MKRIRDSTNRYWDFMCPKHGVILQEALTKNSGWGRKQRSWKPYCPICETTKRKYDSKRKGSDSP